MHDRVPNKFGIFDVLHAIRDKTSASIQNIQQRLLIFESKHVRRVARSEECRYQAPNESLLALANPTIVGRLIKGQREIAGMDEVVEGLQGFFISKIAGRQLCIVPFLANIKPVARRENATNDTVQP